MDAGAPVLQPLLLLAGMFASLGKEDDRSVVSVLGCGVCVVFVRSDIEAGAGAESGLGCRPHDQDRLLLLHLLSTRIKRYRGSKTVTSLRCGTSCQLLHLRSLRPGFMSEHPTGFLLARSIFEYVRLLPPPRLAIFALPACFRRHPSYDLISSFSQRSSLPSRYILA